MFSLKPLNSKETKTILELIKSQWGAEIKLDFQFFKSADNSIQIVSREFAQLPLGHLKVNSAGLYFGQLTNSELRLSIEGSQLIGPFAKKNILNLDDASAARWISGSDLEINSNEKGFMLIRNRSDFLGTGKLANNRLCNFVPKSRRANIIKNIEE